MRAVVDADCIVAGTIAASGAAPRLLDLWRTGTFELIASPQLVQEAREALLRPRIAGRYGITPEDVEALAHRIEEESIWLADPQAPPRAVPGDPDDDYLVALALAGEAEALVTRDRHFEGVQVGGLRILFPGVFVAELEGRHRSEP